MSRTHPPHSFYLSFSSVPDFFSITLHLSILALSCWNFHRPTKSAKKVAERDFIALNKASVQSGLTTAQEQAQFRATHDIRRRDESECVSSRSKPVFPPDMVFGLSTRPSTPIFDLLEHRYQERWLAERRALQRRQKEKISMRVCKIALHL